MIKMSDLLGFVNDLEKIIYGLGFKLILKRNNKIYHAVYLVLILKMIIELLCRRV